MVKVFILITIMHSGLFPVIAQITENYSDLIYHPPTGGIKETGNGFIAFTKLNHSSKEYARILIYEALPSSGNLEKDFETDWNELVKLNYSPANFTDQSVSPFKDGYSVKIGVAPFMYANQNQAVMLATISDGKTKLSYVFITNTQRYEKELEDFGSSLSFGHQATQLSQNQEKNQTIMHNEPGQTTATTEMQPAASTGSFTFHTTNFDDGWTAVQENSWVILSKNNVQLLLHYGIDFDDAMRANPAEICWNKLAAERYIEAQRFNYNYSALNFSYYYMEADVTDKKSGQTLFVSFRVVPRNGVAYCIEIRSPGKEVFNSFFPTQESIENMLNYNRFAIHYNDLTGTWNSSSSSSIMLYNIYTGGNAGMNYASINDEFIFSAGGTYTSRHVGAASSYGNTSHFNDQFSGNHIVTNWDITLTNRRDGRSDAYHAFFEAVPGGRILHLTNKQFSGLTFKLFKVN